VLPSNIPTVIESIDTMGKSLDAAYAPQSVALRLKDDIDISRGDMIVGENNPPRVGQDIEMMICWLNEKPMVLNGKYILRHTTKEARCVVKEVQFKVNINTLEKDMEDKHIGLNDIGRVRIRTTQPLFYDSYRTNRITGSVILIDEGTFVTVCAGMIV